MSQRVEQSSRFATRGVALLVPVLVVAQLAIGPGCGGTRQNAVATLPPPVQTTTLGPGDIFAVVVVGERELPQEYRVQPDGTVDFPYVGRVHVASKEPQEVADILRAKLEEEKILTNPQLTLAVKQYNSKHVTIIGSVSHPGNVAWTEGLRLVDALSQAGWFTQMADRNVVVTRQVGPDKTVSVPISVDAITDGRALDVYLQAGDTIAVDQRTF
jgi:protein involved in polysaccharide export with SLBB domain